MNRSFAALLLSIATVVAHAQATPFARYGCADADRACMHRVIHDHASHKLETWNADLTQPVTERIHVAPPVLLEYMLLENHLQGFKEVPRAPVLDTTFLRDVQDALRELPPQVLRTFESKLVGIYLVDDLGGTGFTDVVFDAQGRGAAGYIVLDAAVLSRHTANAWATWKENTPFKPDPAWRLEARIEHDDADNRKNAIQYILLHELGHVVSIGSDEHPPWWKPVRELPPPPAQGWPYFDLSWSLDRTRNEYQANRANGFALRRNLVYYLGARLEGAQMLPAYEALARTNFPTLYAATRPADDFAEAFVSYVHVRLMNRPWDVTLWKDGAKAMTLRSCWGEPRCAAKEVLLHRLFAGP